MPIVRSARQLKIDNDADLKSHATRISSCPCPGGTSGNSPTFQRWVKAFTRRSPKGMTESVVRRCCTKVGFQ
jgi:hypothetical protein